MTGEKEGRYINPYTDFGFKKLFGTEMNKDLLVSFLNSLFNNSESEIEDVQYLRILSRLLDRSKALQDRVFDKLFRQAEIAKYSDAERRQYEASLKEYWDYTSTLDTAYGKGMKEGMEKGMAKGKEEGMAEATRSTALKMKLRGFTLEEISAITSLPVEEIEKL